LIRATEETLDEDKAAVGLTDEHILLTVQELIGAGFDTIASTLQWTILFMITHPDIQDIFTFIPLSETKCTYDITD
jgi:cytochrome P450